MVGKKLRITVNSISRGGGGSTLQEKTVYSGNQDQIVVPDEGYDGMSRVTVKANVLQTKTVSPSDKEQIIAADEGYTALAKVTVKGVSLQEKAVTLGPESQSVTADPGYDGLSKVTVGAVAVDETLTVSGMAADAAAVGQRFTKLTQGATTTGIVKAGGTVTMTSALEDGTSDVTTFAMGANDVPTTMTRNGKTCALTWEGF